MSKRFTDTEKWKRPWFRHLSDAHKLLWIYICDNCDIAGIWYVDLELAGFLLRTTFDPKETKEVFAKQIVEIDEGNRWFIKDFIAFQYGQLVPNNNLHRSVASILAKFSISGAQEPLNGPLSGAKDKDKDKVKVKEKDKRGGVGEVSSPPFRFEDIWQRYPRKEGRRDAERHFNATVKNLDDWQRINRALDAYLLQIRKKQTDPQYIKMGSTWFNNWQDEIYQEGSYGNFGGQGFSGNVTYPGATRRTSGLRKIPLPGEILAGVRDSAPVRLEVRPALGDGNNDHGQPLSGMGETHPVEKKQD